MYFNFCSYQHSKLDDSIHSENLWIFPVELCNFYSDFSRFSIEVEIFDAKTAKKTRKANYCQVQIFRCLEDIKHFYS